MYLTCARAPRSARVQGEVAAAPRARGLGFGFGFRLQPGAAWRRFLGARPDLEYVAELRPNRTARVGRERHVHLQRLLAPRADLPPPPSVTPPARAR